MVSDSSTVGYEAKGAASTVAGVRSPLVVQLAQREPAPIKRRKEAEQGESRIGSMGEALQGRINNSYHRPLSFISFGLCSCERKESLCAPEHSEGSVSTYTGGWHPGRAVARSLFPEGENQARYREVAVELRGVSGGSTKRRVGDESPAKPDNYSQEPPPPSLCTVGVGPRGRVTPSDLSDCDSSPARNFDKGA